MMFKLGRCAETNLATAPRGFKQLAQVREG